MLLERDYEPMDMGEAGDPLEPQSMETVEPPQPPDPTCIPAQRSTTGQQRRSMATGRGSAKSSHLSRREIDEANGWTYVPREQPLEQPLFESPSGVRAPVDENSSPYECLSEFMTQDFWKLIKTETNRYAAQMKTQVARKGQLKNGSLLARWKPVTLIELKKFFSIIIHMTLVQKESIDFYWSTTSILQTSFAAKMMSRDRFRAIYSCLHLNDNNHYITRGCENYDAFFKLRPYFDELCRLCEAHYIPDENLTIDEVTSGFRSRIDFKVYNKDKPIKYGMKMFMLCDAETGYALRMIPYTGDPNTVQEFVMRLMEPYLGKWHTVYMDRYFTIPTVFDLLWDQNTRAVGTVIQNWPGLPQEWRHQTLQVNEMAFCHRGNLTACKWKDKRYVFMLSTKHGASWSEVKVKSRGGCIMKLKPDCILDHNVNKVGVDLSDQYVYQYTPTRKSMKWWKKMFFHFVARSMVNSYIIYNKSRPENKSQGFAKYLTDCGEAMALEAGLDEAQQLTRGPHANANATRLNGRHFIERIPASDKKEVRTRVCKVCADTIKKRTGKRGRKETTFYCPDCNIPLCANMCFRKFHTQRDYTL